MKLQNILALSALMIFTLAFGMGTGYGYTIDGKVNDWGINLYASGAEKKPYLDNHLPSGGLDIDVVTEDNADKYTEWTRVYPLYSWYNYFDAEAMYFDNDQTYAYIAIITGLPKQGYDPPGNTAYGNPYYKFKPGDIAIDADNNGTYEFGIDIDTGNLINVTAWDDVYYSAGSTANPWRIKTGSDVGTASFVYSADSVNTHYVLETAILLSDLGLDDNSIHPVTIHWTMECGNDYLNLNADVNPVPEPATLFLLGTGLIGLSTFARKRFGKKYQ